MSIKDLQDCARKLRAYAKKQRSSGLADNSEEAILVRETLLQAVREIERLADRVDELE
jgi:hypothetical protein